MGTLIAFERECELAASPFKSDGHLKHPKILMAAANAALIIQLRFTRYKPTVYPSRCLKHPNLCFLWEFTFAQRDAVAFDVLDILFAF